MKKKVSALFALLVLVVGISFCNVTEAQGQWRQRVLERPAQMQSSQPTLVDYPAPPAPPRGQQPAPPPPRYNYFPNYRGYYGGGYGGYGGYYRPHISVHAGRYGGGFGISGPGYSFHFSF